MTGARSTPNTTPGTSPKETPPSKKKTLPRGTTATIPHRPSTPVTVSSDSEQDQGREKSRSATPEVPERDRQDDENEGPSARNRRKRRRDSSPPHRDEQTTKDLQSLLVQALNSLQETKGALQVETKCQSSMEQISAMLKHQQEVQKSINNSTATLRGEAKTVITHKTYAEIMDRNSEMIGDFKNTIVALTNKAIAEGSLAKQVEALIKQIQPLVTAIPTIEALLQKIAHRGDRTHTSGAAPPLEKPSLHCIFCDEDGHASERCRNYLEFSQRAAKAKELNICQFCANPHEDEATLQSHECSAKDRECNRCSHLFNNKDMCHHSPLFCSVKQPSHGPSGTSPPRRSQYKFGRGTRGGRSRYGY